MKIKNILILLVVFVLCISCTKKQTVTTITSPQEEFERAMNLYNQKKYNSAINIFQNLIFNFPGTSYGADAQFYLADAYFLKKDYQSAIPEFEFFINSFIGNQYLEDAYYKLALAYFYLAPQVGKDQVILAKTIEIIENLEERFPQTKYADEIRDLKIKIADRWAEKNYLIGELYFKGGEYEAAQIYFDDVMSEYPQSKWADWSTYYIGQIFEKTDSITQAISVYQSLLSDEKDPQVKNLAQRRLTVLEQNR